MNQTFLLLVFNLLIRLGYSQSQVYKCEPISLNDSLVTVKLTDSLFQLVRSHISKNDFIKALEVNAISEKIALEKFGRISSVYGACCHLRGIINYFSANYSEAEKWYVDAIEIREKTLGKNNRDYAGSLSNLGALYNQMGNFEKAKPLLLEVKSIRLKLVGNEHPEYAASLNNLANLYRDMGSFDEAEPYYIEANVIRKKSLGMEHPDYAQSLNNLSILYSLMGYYERAEPLFLESKIIIEKVLGKNHPDYAQSLNNLAILNMDLGKFEKSEQLYLEAMHTRKIIFGMEHPTYAESLLNLANLYIELGDFEKAELYYLEASMIFEKIFGKGHPNYATSLSNLANLNWSKGNYSRAEMFYLDSKNIREKSLGTKHPDYAQSLNNLANLYRDMGDFALAEKYYLESKFIWEKLRGKEHPNYAQSLNNMAFLYMISGNYEKAESLYLEGKAIREKILGKEHPDYTDNLNGLIKLFQKQNRFLEAEPLLKEGLTYTKRRLVKGALFLSEQELSKYASNFNESSNNLNAIIVLGAANEAQIGILPGLAFDNSLFYKGFLLSAASKLNSIGFDSPESIEIKRRLKGYRRRLAAEYAKPIADRKMISEMEEKANSTEKDLARSVAFYTDAIRQVKWQEIQERLKKSEVAIEFVHFKFDSPEKTNSTIYAVLLLKSGDIQPTFIPLFEEKKLDSMMNVSKNISIKANDLYTFRGAEPITEKKQFSKNLFDLIWKPLEKYLENGNTIYFSPSGQLLKLNHHALPLGNGKTLADKYNLVQVGSTRQLVIRTQNKIENNDAVLYGGIQYEQDTTIQIIEPLFASRSIGELLFNNIDSTLRGGSWNYLTGSEVEVNAIGKIMQNTGIQTQLITGYNATEESFKNIDLNTNPSPRILHIATHGYFFSDPKINGKHTATSGLGESIYKISDNPMLRSGLIMAGGNAVWKGKKVADGQEDGILTAYEISQMNLSNTELVVLSACETGLGDIQGNEGVYGLQRAFKIAGAKYLIMSLWQVPDKQTSLLMTTFYKKWLEEKQSIPSAFHAAQKELRDIGLDPYQWAGFVLVE